MTCPARIFAASEVAFSSFAAGSGSGSAVEFTASEGIFEIRGGLIPSPTHATTAGYVQGHVRVQRSDDNGSTWQTWFDLPCSLQLGSSAIPTINDAHLSPGVPIRDESAGKFDSGIKRKYRAMISAFYQQGTVVATEVDGWVTVVAG
jgi:hypothetical protein